MSQIREREWKAPERSFPTFDRPLYVFVLRSTQVHTPPPQVLKVRSRKPHREPQFRKPVESPPTHPSGTGHLQPTVPYLPSPSDTNATRKSWELGTMSSFVRTLVFPQREDLGVVGGSDPSKWRVCPVVVGSPVRVDCLSEYVLNSEPVNWGIGGFVFRCLGDVNNWTEKRIVEIRDFDDLRLLSLTSSRGLLVVLNTLVWYRVQVYSGGGS